MKRRLLSTQNDLVDGLRVLSQHTALQLSTRCLGGTFQLVVMAARVLEVTGAYGEHIGLSPKNDWIGAQQQERIDENCKDTRVGVARV